MDHLIVLIKWFCRR